MKTTKLTIILSIIGLTLTASSALAAYTPISRNTCALSVHPYNPNASGTNIIGPTDSQWFNIFSQGTPQCDNHLEYPLTYKPQPPNKTDLPLKSISGISEKSSPETIHNHKYFNDSVQDSYYYKSYTDSFQIILESDTLNNTDLSKIICYTPGEAGTIRTTAGCSGTLVDWGGTEITFDQGTGIINWKFATGGSGRPRLYGINPGLHGKTGVPDTNNEQNRKLEFGVKLTSKNVNSEVWTATTTSRTLVRDQAILTSSANFSANPDDITACTNDGTNTSNNDFTKWCTLSDSQIGAGSQIEQKGVQSYYANGKTYSTGGKSYYWKQVGIATTAWQKPTPAPLACDDLQWNGPFLKKVPLGVYLADSENSNSLLSNQEAILKFNTIYQNGTAPKRPLEYRWVAFNGEANRPNWFINNDTLFVLDQVFKTINNGFSPLLINSLPLKVLSIAHAAPQGTSTSSAGSTAALNSIKNSGTTSNPLKDSGILDTQSAPLSNSVVMPGLNELKLVLGKFSDNAPTSSPILPIFGNPFTDDDGLIYYSGGTAGVTLGVQAYYTDGLSFPGQGAWVDVGGMMKQKAEKCHLELTIQDRPNVPPPLAICQQLIVKFFENGVQVAKENLVAGKTYNIQIDQANSKKTDGSPISKYTWALSNTGGTDVTGAISLDPTSTGSCGKGLNDLSCKYNYTPHANDRITFLADPHDNVAACRVEQIIPAAPVVPICKALNLTTLGLIGGEIPVNAVISLSADPRDTNDAPRNPVVYEAKGSGTFAPVAGNPLGCPRRSNNFSAPSECKYTFQANSVNSGDQLTVKVQADDGVPACTATFPIVKTPVTPICKDLNLNILGLVGGQIPVNTPITLSTDPRDTNNNPRQPVVYEKTGAGTFTLVSGNPLTCTTRSSRNFEAPSECKYTFSTATAVPGDNLSVKVKQDDGVPACSATFPVVETPKVEEKCLALNLQVNGQYTLNPLLTPGASYSLQTAPITTKGNPVIMVEWTENGSGRLIGNAGNPAICPAFIDNGSVVTPAFCRYIYAAPTGTNENYGFSVRAVPDDGVAACQGRAQNYNPPVVKNPYCLYLDLDYYPEPFNPLTSSGMNATVVMSDGSKYNDRVRFTSTNGVGTFSGGLSAISSAPYDLRSLTDIRNNTTTVNFSGGNSDSGINVLLSDTSVIQTAACQRQLRPTPKPPQVCTEPPRITRNGNTFTTPVGNSNEYCWSITGNALFNNGRNTATGRTVVLDKNYDNFNLRVEDCNPQFRNFCSDTYKADNTPSIEKKISKADSPLRYGTKINYSTTGNNSAQTVAYKIEFTPSNYTSGTYMLAKIYDPAFEGNIQGYKTDGKGSGKKSPGGEVNFSDIKNTLKVTQYPQTTINACSGSISPKDKCYILNNGYLQLNGINSPEKITIEYTGQLKSGITRAECQNGTYCNEQFINQSYVTEMEVCVARISPTGVVSYDCTDVPKPPLPRCEYFYNDKGERVSVNGNNQDCKMPKYTIASNTTIAELVCQYFLTRASGDIFLEDELKYGIDVSKCYPFKNISSTITKPAKPLPPKAPSTGTAQIVNISHEICSSGQANFAGFQGTNEQKTALKDLFGADISKLSSQICEVGLVPGSDWDKTSINTAITQNIGKLTRWDDGNARSQTINNIQQIIDQGGVYYYKGNGETVTIPELKIPEGSGALTIIVENADLQINGNIEYSANTPATNAKQISSLGVIVINGNMYVAPSVSKLAGAYFVQRTLAETDVAAYLVGNIFSGNKADNKQDSEVQLTINGSIYGNIGPLFERRNAAGDINNDEGAITIRYDQRIIQNPPAGLSEILGSFSQSQIAQ